MPRNTKLEVGEAKPVFDEPRSRDSRSRTLFRFDTTTIEIKEKINPALESKEKGDDADLTGGVETDDWAQSLRFNGAGVESGGHPSSLRL